ncbi:MAG: hypothetical protein AAGF12_00175 [Myxococcota bacterium]
MAPPHECQPTKILSGRVVFAVTADVGITILDVQQWTLETAEALFRESATLARPPRHSLVSFLGAEPTAMVRKRLVELQEDVIEAFPRLRSGRTVVLTNSAITRGAVTAWRWISNSNTVAYAQERVEDAAAWIVDDSSDAASVVGTYRAAVALSRR